MTGRSYAVDAPRMTRRADLQKEYEAALVRHGYRPDTAQQHAVARLSDLAVRLRGAENRSKAGFFGRWRTRAGRRDGSAAGERGVYLWGGVGRGKTFLMDLFHAHVGVPLGLALTQWLDWHAPFVALGSLSFLCWGVCWFVCAAHTK